MSDACCGPGEAHDDEDGQEREPERLWEVRELRFAAVSGLLLLAALIAGWFGVPRVIELSVETAALLAGAATFVPFTLRGLLRGRIGVGTLMSIAAIGAVILGQVGEAATLAFLFSVSEGLEEYSLARTRRGLRALLSLVPERTTVRRDGIEQVMAPAQVRVGDRMLVRPGERMATDGIVRVGRTALDVSAITGESMPVEAGPGTEVPAGAINGTAAVEVEVTTTAEDNSLARIVAIVEAEQSRKGASQRLADRVARPLVPAILVVAALIAVVGSLVGDPTTWIERALVVLVAASPCALAIAVPVTVVSAVGAASRLGCLVKGGAALEALGRIRGLALDKTGTLTRNRPTVIDVATVGATRAEVLVVAAALEARSEHPLAAAILAAAEQAGHPARAADDVEAVPGAGLVGRLEGQTVRLGRPGWLDPGALAAWTTDMQHAGATVVVVQRDDQLLGAVAVRDQLRPEAPGVIAELRRKGYEVVMLTGDNPRTAATLAAEAGVDTVHAELRPEDKAALVAELKTWRRTAMVGDGVNDAPALATADLGVAMGAMGSDVAIETADVALMGEDLRHLPRALDHARRARWVMLQNIGLSLAIIVVLMPLALLGVLGLATVVAVHELAEVLVIANGVRAGRAGTPRTGIENTPAAAHDFTRPAAVAGPR